MKRFIALLLALVMVFPLCACGGSDAPAAEAPAADAPAAAPAESGKTGGTLRRGWAAKTAIKPLEVQKVGSGTVVTVRIINPVKYASYVEYGHRQTPGRFVPAIGTRLKKGWVDGKFMLTKSEMELESELPGLIERKLKQLLDGALK